MAAGSDVVNVDKNDQDQKSGEEGKKEKQELYTFEGH